MRVYKVFTHDLRSPVVGGEPVWNGQLPHQLPHVSVARSETCGTGWAATRSPVNAIHHAGLLPDGRPARVFMCYLEGEYCETTDILLPGHAKLRASSLLIDSEVPIEAVVEELAATTWGQYAGNMTHQLLRWMEALKRPLWSETIVGYSLYEALKLQGGGSMKVAALGDIPAVDQIQFQLKRMPVPPPNVTRQHQVDFRAPNGTRDVFPLVNDRMNQLSNLNFLTANTVWSPAQIAGAYSAKCAIEHYYNVIRSPYYEDPEKLTHGIIDCYRWGMQEAVAVNPSAMVYTMEDRSGKLTAQKPLATFENQLRTAIEAKAQYTPGVTFDGSRRDADGAGPAGHGERNPLNMWEPKL